MGARKTFKAVLNYDRERWGVCELCVRLLKKVYQKKALRTSEHGGQVGFAEIVRRHAPSAMNRHGSGRRQSQKRRLDARNRRERTIDRQLSGRRCQQRVVV